MSATPRIASFETFPDEPGSQRAVSVTPLLQFRPPIANENGAGETEMESKPDTRNCRTSSESANDRRTRLHRSFILYVNDPAKVIAQKIGASHRTVEADRIAIPQSWDRMVAYGRLSPAFAMEMAIEMGLEFDRDRESYAAFLSLQRRIRGE